MAPPWEPFPPPPSFSSVVRWFHTKVILHIPLILSKLWEILGKTTGRQNTTNAVKCSAALTEKKKVTARINKNNIHTGKGELYTNVPSFYSESFSGEFFHAARLGEVFGSLSFFTFFRWAPRVGREYRSEHLQIDSRLYQTLAPFLWHDLCSLVAIYSPLYTYEFVKRRLFWQRRGGKVCQYVCLLPRTVPTWIQHFPTMFFKKLLYLSGKERERASERETTSFWRDIQLQSDLDLCITKVREPLDLSIMAKESSFLKNYYSEKIILSFVLIFNIHKSTQSMISVQIYILKPPQCIKE